MNRSEFSPWGDALDDREFMQAVAMVAALAQAAAVPADHEWRRVFAFFEGLGREIEGGGRSEWVWFVVRDRLEIEPARLPELLRAAEATPRALADRWRAGHRRSIEVELVGALGHGDAVAWISALVATNLANIVYRGLEAPEVESVWGVPTRVAVHGRDVAAEMWRAAVVGCVRRRPVALIDVVGQQGERDLVLLPSPLRGSLAAALTEPRGARAQIVVVLGGVDVPAIEAGPMIELLRREFRADGVIVVDVRAAEAEAWLELLLTSDARWLAFVWSHARRHRRSHPFIAITPGLRAALSPWAFVAATGARADRQATREGVGRMSARLAVARRLLGAAGRGIRRRWLESTLAVMRPDSRMGGPMDTEHMRARLVGLQAARGGLGRAVRAEVRPPSTEPRRVHLVVARRDDEEQWRRVERLVPGQLHRVTLWIAAVTGEGTPADRPFPEPERRDGEDSAVLTIVCYTVEPRGERLPKSAEVRLPAQGPSSRAEFMIRSLPEAGGLTARFVVLHRQRVLQTLLLTQSAGEGFRWQVELRVQDDLGPALLGRQRFDAAIVLNPSTALAVGAHGAGLALLPAGADGCVTAIQELLSQESIVGEASDAADPVSREALYELALHGHELWDAVVNRDGMREQLSHARRVQVVEAREGAYLPVELFYERPAPRRSELCPGARQAMSGGGCVDSACAGDPTRYICPRAFWGLSRVIERMPHPGAPLAGGAELSLVKGLDDERESIAPFTRAAFAASTVVQRRDRRRITAALQRALGAAPRRMRGWAGVARAVKLVQPSLLALVVHADSDERTRTLELSGERMVAPHLTEQFIRGDGCTQPLVLLIGCNTRAPLAGYRSFAGRFLRHGAAIVVCTVAAISPADAADFIEEFTATLRDVAGSEPAPFGELMLATRQRLFGMRWPLAFGVVSCGDAQWYIDVET